MAIKKCAVSLIALCVVSILLHHQQVATSEHISDDELDDRGQEKKRADDAKANDRADQLPLLLYDRWNRETNPNHRESIRDNEIESGEGSPAKSSSDHKSQQDYVCGRAVANKKYKDILTRDANYQMSVARAKYRPIEIRMPRIIGGDDTAPGEFPWTVSIKLNGQPICGGSLIDKMWILTAAHCVVGYNPKNLTVRLGAYRIKDSSETQTIDLPVSMFVVHKDYSMPRPFSNDIAMLKLIETVDYTDYIIPICLPTEDQLTTTQLGSVQLNDYSNNRGFESSSKMGSGEDTGGIVISTKMSDHEIAKCFNRLEQNYLSSIGLGAIADVATSTGGSTPEQQPSQAASLPIKQAGASSPAMLLMNEPVALESSSSIASGSTNDKAGSTTRPVRPFQLKPGFIANVLPNPGDSYVSIGHHHHHHHHHHHQHFEPTTVGLSQSNNPLDFGAYEDTYFGSPWNRRQVVEESARREPQSPGIKLSRLPISKELLREIQSIGSGQMPSLDLGPQAAASDSFVAMANDLNQQATSTDQLERPVGGSANNRNRFKTNNVVRTAVGEDDDEVLTVDDPTKYSGLSGTVVGWGWIRELDGEDQVNNKGYPSVTLQKVRLPILRNHVCEAWFQSQSKKITLLPSQFCAGFSSGGKDACRGDSGGPMIIEDSSDTGRYKLIGIVSAGIGCARPSLPGLYTRVASFLPWINAQMTRY